jgi:6-pyruvoyl-tetrahydropterin synthase related domain
MGPMRVTASKVATFLCVAGAVVVVVWQFHPLSLLLTNTTTAGGDTGAHVDLAADLSRQLLPNLHLTGWSPDWYDGYPVFTFYFPLPYLLIVALEHLISYNVAFKVVTSSGSVTLPVAAWAFGRLSGMRRPIPACMAAATLPYLFNINYEIYGGNIASTLAGEFAFSLSLSVGLVFLGVVARGLKTGRHRALAAGLLAITMLCHMIPGLFVAGGAVILVLWRPDRRRLWWGVTVGAAGAAITAFWALPFAWRQQYTTNMGFEKVTQYLHYLFPSDQWWAVALAGLGVVISVWRKRRMGQFLSVMAVLSAVAFVIAPAGKLYNARLLPLFVICLFLLAGVGVGEAALLAGELRDRLVRHQSRGPAGASLGFGGGGLAGATVDRRWSSMGRYLAETATPILAGLAAVGLVLTPIVRPLAFLLPRGDHPSFVPDWIEWNYSGYQGKADWTEYHSLITEMAALGRRYGCGRAMWEYNPDLNDLGTPEALMLLPYWTDGCIDSMEGLLFESSATTPYHFLNQAELSSEPSEAMVGLPYSGLDVAEGVQHLQLLGVRYYMAETPEAQIQAAADPDLRLLAESGPWKVVQPNGSTLDRTWDIYEVLHTSLVTPLTAQPAVLTGVNRAGAAGTESATGAAAQVTPGASAQPASRDTSVSWLDAVEPWYLDPARWDVFLVASGPASWQRVPASNPLPSVRPAATTTVSHVRMTDDRISFDVSHVGTPVLVKVSYFPNWQASGATGPYRASPNLMVVVPTSHHVVLHYGYTPVDDVGWLLTLAGLLGVGWMAWFDRRPRRRSPPGPGRVAEEGQPGELRETALADRL